ncbi:hypothetical protein GCM10009547_18460 [Sporichthya brevicatena]|uniref:Sortase n=2 Tax=Sporichthya brevicatena TaxID=171442 RepID=A0ABN1GQM3_9ACTN
MAVAALGTGLLALGGPTARADSTFEAVADARLAAVNFTAEPPVIFGQLVDAGGSVAQASLNSLGNSTAFASDPYPSESAVLAPGLIAGLTGGATSDVVPAYPLIASSNFPSVPEKRVQAGPVTLEATSGVATSRGSTANGANTGLASVTRDPSDDRVTARAEVAGSSVVLSDALVLNGVRSAATASRLPSGQIELTSSFDVAALTIAGQRVPLSDALTGPDGALSAATAAGRALLDALAAQGTTIQYLPAEKTEDGITSAGLRIRSIQAAPPELASGLERVIAEVTIGQTAARVTNRALPQTGGLGPDLGTTPALTPGTGAPVDGAVAPGVLPGTAPGGAVPGVAPGQAQLPATDVVSAIGSPGALITDLDIGRFYLVLLLAGAALLAWVQLIRVFGGAPAAKGTPS